MSQRHSVRVKYSESDIVTYSVRVKLSTVSQRHSVRVKYSESET